MCIPVKNLIDYLEVSAHVDAKNCGGSE